MMNEFKPGKYICASSTGISFNNRYLKLNAVISLTEADLTKPYIQKFLKNNFLKFMGEQTPEKEIIQSDPVVILEPEPQDQISPKPQGAKPLKNKKEKRNVEKS